MAHQIKIDADLNLSKLKKSFAELAAMISGMSQKHAIELFDKQSMDFLRGQAKDALGFLKREYDGLTQKAEQYRDELKKMATLTDEHRQKEKQLLEVEKQRAELMRDMVKLKSKLGEEEKPGFMEGMGSQMKGLPGGGIISKLMSGAGLRMIAGMGVGAALVGGAWHVISRAREGNAQYNEGVRSRVSLMGRGIGDYRGLHSGLAGMGMSPEEIRQAQLQSTDIFGRSGSGAESVFQRARFARANGLDLSQVQNAGAGLRATMGVKEGTRAFAELEASLMANKIKDAIGPYLETAAGMLTELNDNGMNFDPAALTALGALVNRRGMSAEAAAKMLTDFDSRIKSSTGELNAFFQASFAGGGVGVGRNGRGTIGASQEAVNLGLFGLDAQKAGAFLKPGELGAYKRLGMSGGDGFRKRFSGIQSQVEGMGFGGGDEGVMQKGLFLQRIFGTKSGAEGLKYYNALGSAAAAKTPGEREKILQDIKDQFGSNEEKVLKIQGEQKALLERIGETVSPAFQMMNQTLLSIDKTLLQIATKGFGIEMPEGPEEHRERMLQQQGLSTERLATMSESEIGSEMGRIRGQISKSKKLTKTNMRGVSPDVAQAMYSQSVGEQGDMAEVLGLLRQQLEIQRAHLREAKKPPMSKVQGRASTTAVRK
jgi:hypothetical protein